MWLHLQQLVFGPKFGTCGTFLHSLQLATMLGVDVLREQFSPLVGCYPITSEGKFVNFHMIENCWNPYPASQLKNTFKTVKNKPILKGINASCELAPDFGAAKSKLH